MYAPSKMQTVTTKPKKRKSVKETFRAIYSPNESNEKYYVGEFLLGTCHSLLSSASVKCRARINNLDETDYLILKFEDESTASVNLLADAPLILRIIMTNVFSIKFTQDGENVHIQLYFTQLPIKSFTSQVSRLVRQVFQIIFHGTKGVTFNLDEDDGAQQCVENIYDVYRKVRQLQAPSEIPNIDVQSVHLKPTLRPYQEDAVRWMIHRETTKQRAEENHPAYASLTLPHGTQIFYDKYTGFVELQRPMVAGLPTGGILADEMGLGKTVEVLACILHNKRGADVDAGPAKCKPMILKKGRKRPPDVRVPKVDKKAKIEPQKPVHYRVALNMWYADMLQSVNKRVSVKPTENCVQCVCGQAEDYVNQRIVVCGECGKRQHSTCMGFDKFHGDYFCPQCWKNKPMLQSNATLIVCPMSLLEQWSNEICKHVKSGLSVLQYEGSIAVPVYPLELQNYDLVITTYSVLQTELWQADYSQTKSLRSLPKYAPPGSPLTLIEWQRLCFDEAQLMETGPKISEMASKLTARHRWAITGTPVSNGLTDLYPLIDFLQLEPYSIEPTWNNVLYHPYLNGDMNPMLDFLSKILWRTKKRDVIDQINIPPQSVKEYSHEFTAVERYFYDREHEMCCNEFVKNLSRFRMETPLMSLNKSQLKQILTPVLALWQACAHHNVVRGRYLVTKKSVNSMEELLDALIARNISECEDNLRLLVSSFNGAAGIYILLRNPVQAIECYRKVLQLSAKFTEDKTSEVKLTVDKLQLIHAMHNVAEIIVSHPNLVIDNTLRDASLKDDCADLENKYMEKFINLTKAAVQTNAKLANEVIQLQDQLQLEQGQWYSAILDNIAADRLTDELESRINVILDNNGYIETIKSVNEKRIFYMINVKEEEINFFREKTINAVNDLYTICDDKIVVKEEFVQSAADCHLRPTQKVKKQCILCKTSSELKEYESKLFCMTKQISEDKSNKGSWKPCIEEQLMRVILAIGKIKDMDSPLINDGDIFITIFDIYKKEFKEIRKLWTCLDRQICASDEVDMCKLRMSLKIEEERATENRVLKNLSYSLENPHANINQLREHELNYHISKLESEEVEYSRDLEKCLGTHKYLQTLHTQQTPDPCPICKNQLDNKWNTLKCGHCYCIDCVQMLLGRVSGKYIMCSVCREKQDINEINYVVIKTQPQEEVGLKIKGNCSTKVEAITKLVMQLRLEDAKVKILIFSSWIDILKVIKSVFDINSISSEVIDSQQNQKRLQVFQSPAGNVTALLLPITLGSKGLNITEATHVIFVEPLLDPADELQAIGRVHRIGQTKPTVVHKFLIKDTIEENIHAATSTNASDWDKNRVTLQQIKQLFFKEVTSVASIVT